MRDLSILIPTYNDECLTLARKLKEQADGIVGLRYEILVADDGSTDQAVISTNREIESIDNCHYIEKDNNVGRSAIRNFLGREARYDWLIFIDCRVNINDVFLRKYIDADSQADVICGGLSIGGDAEEWKDNLRYRYEKNMEASYSADRRNFRGYRSFRASNFMIKRDILLKVPFNEDMSTYGYEDVVFGKSLKQHGFTLEHIDNAASMYEYEKNELFVEKTEEALRTLKMFSKEIGDFSPIITLADTLKQYHLQGAARFLFNHINKKFRTNLVGNNPKLLYYKLYKLGYYITLGDIPRSESYA